MTTRPRLGRGRRASSSAPGGSPRTRTGRPAAAPGPPPSTAPAGVLHELQRAERGEHHVERRRRRRAGRSPCRGPPGPRTPVSSSMRRACCSWRSARSRPTAVAPRAVSQRAHWAAPQPTSRTSLPATSPSTPGVGLVDALGAPDEADVAQERAVRGLVLVGVGVPVPAVGPLASPPRRPYGGPGARASACLEALDRVRRPPGSRLARSPSGPTARLRVSTDSCSSGISAISSASRGWIRSRVWRRARRAGRGCRRRR